MGGGLASCSANGWQSWLGSWDPAVPIQQNTLREDCVMPKQVPLHAQGFLPWGCLGQCVPRPHSLQPSWLELQLKQTGTEQGCGARAAPYLLSYLQ